ncbi:MAG TPA: DUF1428 domain-containing protein [Methylomirabilota bacterium]|nr:DUF1428 domain-containing protein [Methylomirabilota bacterium]
MPYVDGFIVPIPKKNIPAYTKLAKLAAKIWREYGALEYRECLADDLKAPGLWPFPKTVKAKPGETIILAYIVYKSRAQRDRINAKVMQDPRLAGMAKEMPFDVKRMAYGGFKTIVGYGPKA